MLLDYRIAINVGCRIILLYATSTGVDPHATMTFLPPSSHQPVSYPALDRQPCYLNYASCPTINSFKTSYPMHLAMLRPLDGSSKISYKYIGL
jgi:hypothetical protein